MSVDALDYTVIEDDYDIALNIDKEYDKLKIVFTEIKELGFTGTEGNAIRLDYTGDSPYLYLESDKDVNYDSFVKEDWDTYYKLDELVKKSQANIEHVAVFGAFDQNGDQNAISFYMEPPGKARTQEELLLDIKTTHVEIVEHEVEDQLVKEVDQLNNERFYLGNPYDETPSDPVGS